MPQKGYLGTYAPRKCKICKGKIEIINGYRDGHNAEPVAKGRCCADCNSSVVLQARLDILWRRADESKR